jgi:hypothetical protein
MLKMEWNARIMAKAAAWLMLMPERVASDAAKCGGLI